MEQGALAVGVLNVPSLLYIIPLLPVPQTCHIFTPLLDTFRLSLLSAILAQSRTLEPKRHAEHASSTESPHQTVSHACDVGSETLTTAPTPCPGK